MSTVLTKELVAVCMMSGVVLWLEKDRALKLEALLKDPKAPKFVEFEHQLLNISSIEGIYSAQTMDELQRRKNGQWQCKEGDWHDRFEKCTCDVKEIRDLRKKVREARESCKQCEGTGFLLIAGSMMSPCPCSRKLSTQLAELVKTSGK